MLLTEYIYLFARIIMADRGMFIQLISATASSRNLTETYLYEGLLDQWWGRVGLVLVMFRTASDLYLPASSISPSVQFDNMSEPRHRKLTAMGIAALVSTGRPEVLQRLPTEIFNLWLDVFGEIKEATVVADDDERQERLAYKFTDTTTFPSSASENFALNLKRHWELDEAPREYYQGSEGTPEYARRKAVRVMRFLPTIPFNMVSIKQVYDRDPVRTIQLSAYVAAHLREAEAVCGTQAFQATYLSKADPTVLKQIQDELVRT